MLTIIIAVLLAAPFVTHKEPTVKTLELKELNHEVFNLDNLDDIDN